MALGAYVVLYMTEPDFLEIIFLPPKWPSLGFFEYLGKVSYFFLNLVSNESLYSCIVLIAVSLDKPHIWKNSARFLNQLYL